MDEAVVKYQKRRADRIKKRQDAFEEGKHKRDKNGRFTSGGGKTESYGERVARETNGKSGKELNDRLRMLAYEDYDSARCKEKRADKKTCGKR